MRGCHLAVLLALAGVVGGQCSLPQGLWLTWGYLLAVCGAFAADCLD